MDYGFWLSSSCVEGILIKSKKVIFLHQITRSVNKVNIWEKHYNDVQRFILSGVEKWEIQDWKINFFNGFYSTVEWNHAIDHTVRDLN
jgi:hypothetical protein